MTTKPEPSPPRNKHSDLSMSYPPGVVDRFIAWVDSFPGTAWSFFLVMLVVLISVTNGVTWLDGSAEFGTFHLYRTSVPFYPVLSLALIHYLNHVARRVLTAFRPALGESEAEYARFEYELTTLPRRGTWKALGLSLLLTAAFTLFALNSADVFSPLPVLFVVDVAIYVVVFGLTTVFVYHTLHQLRMVSRIHASARNVNLFQSTPLYAFSRLTAQSGIGLLLLNYFSILTDPATFVNPALMALVFFTSIVAVVCFVLPLKGMHDRIVMEKKRLRAEVNTRLEATLQEVFRRADTQNLAKVDQLNLLLSSLIMTREELAKISTWPWETGTLAGFISIFLLPFIVRLLAMLLQFLV